MNRSESITKIAPALINFNSKIQRISKDASNPFHKNQYATLDQIIDEVRPSLNENKLAIMQNVSGDEGAITVKTTLIHESGEWMESNGTTLKLAKNDPQGAGAGITYARRYDLCAFLSLNTGEDDDGNSASGLNNRGIESVTQKQVGEIKIKAKKFAKARNGAEQDVYEALGVRDITRLSKQDAINCIAKLDKWLSKANKEGA